MEDKSVDELSRVKSLGLFDLKDLSNEVQDVINELVEIPTQAESEVLLKAIEDKVVENYPTFEIGVKISDALEEGLAVILNIREILLLDIIGPKIHICFLFINSKIYSSVELNITCDTKKDRIGITFDLMYGYMHSISYPL